MSEKKLLNENTIRRFMKLANVEPLTNSFLREMSTDYDDEEIEEEVVTEQEDEDDMEMDVAMGEVEDEVPVEDPEGDIEADMAPEMDAAGPDVSLTEVEAQLLADLGDRIRAAMGDKEPEGDLEPEAEEFEPEAEELAPEGEPVVGDPEEEEPAMQERLVQEVLKRVTRRIIREKMTRK